MTIVGYIELYGFTGLYKEIEAGQVINMNKIVDTWAENKAYKKALMDAVIDPNHALYNAGGWSSLGEPRVADGSRDRLKFYVDVDFDSEEDKDEFAITLGDIYWEEDIEISPGDVTAPFDYIKFHVDYDIIEDAE